MVRSRELGSAVPPRVSPLILHTRAESEAYLRNLTLPFCFPLLFLGNSIDQLLCVRLIFPNSCPHFPTVGQTTRNCLIFPNCPPPEIEIS